MSDLRDYYREIEAEDARGERSRRAAMIACQCGHDLPGTCPGPANCPNADVGEDEE